MTRSFRDERAVISISILYVTEKKMKLYSVDTDTIYSFTSTNTTYIAATGIPWVTIDVDMTNMITYIEKIYSIIRVDMTYTSELSALT